MLVSLFENLFQGNDISFVDEGGKLDPEIAFFAVQVVQGWFAEIHHKILPDQLKGVEEEFFLALQAQGGEFLGQVQQFNDTGSV